MITKNENDMTGEMMHINLPADKQGKKVDVKSDEKCGDSPDIKADDKKVDPAVTSDQKKFGPEAGQPPDTIEEKIKDWAHDVAASDEQADEILGQDDRLGHHSADMAEKVMDIPEGLDTLIDPLDDCVKQSQMHVVEFEDGK